MHTFAMTDRKQQILVVDDEASIRKVLRRYFESESYKVLEAANRDQTMDAVQTSTVDLITLDINLNGEDGLSLAREIRACSAVPIIMVSGKNDLIDKVVGLEVGADDYISKPFELREVLARVKSVLRRVQLDLVQPAAATAPGSQAQQILFADCILCPNTRDLTKTDGTRCLLTTAEYNLLHTLVCHAHHVLSRDQIMDRMKGCEWSPTDRTIDNQVARLRKKLDAIGVEHAIKTVRGLGYQFTQDVTFNS